MNLLFTSYRKLEWLGKLGFVLMGLLWANIGFAALGSVVATIDTDVAKLKGSNKVELPLSDRQKQVYTAYQFDVPGGSIRQYVTAERNRENVVFAVVWTGNITEDQLKQVFGIQSSFILDQVRKTSVPNASKYKLVEDPGLVVEAYRVNNNRKFGTSGRAWLSGYTPRGRFSLDYIK